jgi:hypothetical protein
VKRGAVGMVSTAAFASGFALGLIVWSSQTHRYRRNLFSSHPWRRLAALGYMRGQPSERNVRVLRDYVNWESHPGLKRRGTVLLRRMENSIS